MSTLSWRSYGFEQQFPVIGPAYLAAHAGGRWHYASLGAVLRCAKTVFLFLFYNIMLCCFA